MHNKPASSTMIHGPGHSNEKASQQNHCPKSYPSVHVRFQRQFPLKPDQGMSIKSNSPFCSIANVVNLPQVVVEALAHGLDLVVLAPGILAASSLASLGRPVVGILLRLTATLDGVAHCLIVSQAVT
jgi:hypothetical protein